MFSCCVLFGCVLCVQGWKVNKGDMWKAEKCGEVCHSRGAETNADTIGEKQGEKEGSAGR